MVFKLNVHDLFYLPTGSYLIPAVCCPTIPMCPFSVVFAQILRTLLHHHAVVLLLPGLFWGRSFLPGPHRHSCREAAHLGRPGNLVVCGLDLAYYWRPDAQWLQQLVHLLLRLTAEYYWELWPVLSAQIWGMTSACNGYEWYLWLVRRGFPGTSWGNKFVIILIKFTKDCSSHNLHQTDSDDMLLVSKVSFYICSWICMVRTKEKCSGQLHVYTYLHTWQSQTLEWQTEVCL